MQSTHQTSTGMESMEPMCTLLISMEWSPCDVYATHQHGMEPMCTLLISMEWSPCDVYATHQHGMEPMYMCTLLISTEWSPCTCLHCSSVWNGAHTYLTFSSNAGANTSKKFSREFSHIEGTWSVTVGSALSYARRHLGSERIS